ncbi:hypothetical protein [Chitinophaga rhizophila]|uniref:Uncharacterized protein n=1 Tax=Chitinophaga rhizophila TaxID=2866212 RepID=A0ABS7GAD0_9BACT|nr:hypothetical protein [Chitinophaga rhizophila]MBW8684618.1 hypothetical protein [Chitinophaga rhizophila]
MKHLFIGLLCCISVVTNCFAQAGDLLKKNISDTMLSPARIVEIADPFDGQKALLKLFPGKYYNLSEGNYKNELINWDCTSCKPRSFRDANEEESYQFPYAEGVATRLLNVISYKDSAGTQYKMLTFNHSAYDPDGLQTSRFTGGTLGIAKFSLTGSLWTMKFFQPAIGAYGAFSKCPTPKPVVIGHDQYAFMLDVVNGPAGGPFTGVLYLIAGTGGAYKEVLTVHDASRTEVEEEEGMSSWSCTYNAPQSDKRFFRDIIVTMKGQYRSTDIESLPEEVKPYVSTNKKGTFTLARRYVYKWGKGYQLQGPAGVTVD